MANITDQFVTSFSELYYSTTPIAGVLGADGKHAEADIRAWFADSTVNAAAVEQSTVSTVDLTTGNAVITLNGVEFTTPFATSNTVTATTLAGLIDANALFTAAASTGVITITLTEGGASFTVVDGNGVTSVTTDFDKAGGVNLVPLVMEIGTLSNEATVIDTPTFGEVYKGKLRGQLDGGQLDAQLYWAPRDPIHQELRRLAESGKEVYVGIKWKASSDADADEELVYFNSFVSSFGIDTTFDDVAKVSCTFVVDGAEHFAGMI